MKRQQKTVILEVTATKVETEKAFLFEIDGAFHWIPKSAIENVDEISKNFEGDIEVAAWLAEKLELS